MASSPSRARRTGHDIFRVGMHVILCPHGCGLVTRGWNCTPRRPVRKSACTCPEFTGAPRAHDDDGVAVVGEDRGSAPAIRRGTARFRPSSPVPWPPGRRQLPDPPGQRRLRARRKSRRSTGHPGRCRLMRARSGARAGARLQPRHVVVGVRSGHPEADIGRRPGR